MSKGVLVIDSSRVIRTLLQIHLQQVGHHVFVCSSSQEALQVLRAIQEAPDLIFLAVYPSLKDDFEVIQYVKAQSRYARDKRELSCQAISYTRCALVGLLAFAWGCCFLWNAHRGKKGEA